MNWRAASNQAFLWVFALGLSPLIANSIEKWAERDGYLHDPSKGVHWVLTQAAVLTDYSYYYYAVFFLAGLATGRSMDSLFRHATASKTAKMASLGFDLRSFAEWIQEQNRFGVKPWPTFLGNRLADLHGLLIRLQDAGLRTPSSDAVHRAPNGGLGIANYLQYVGTFLLNKQFDQAEEAATLISAEIDKLAAIR